MLFMIISNPRPEKPSGAVKARRQYWKWVDPLVESGVVKSIWARPGRGAVVVFDVEDHTHLHRLLNEWAELIPATFDTYPLIDTAAARKHLAKK